MAFTRRVPPLLVSVLVGYFVGSVSFPRLAVRLTSKNRTHSIPNDASTIRTKFGGDYASIVLGTKYGIATGLLDMLKVAIPMACFKYVLYPGELYHLTLSIAGLVGHNWPIYYGFRGGRGFSVMFSSFIIIDWMGTLIVTCLGFLIGTVVVQNPMVAYISWLWLMIPWLFLRTSKYTYLLYTMGLLTIFMITTIPEIKAFIALNQEGHRAAFFGEELYSSSPRWRGMKRIQERLNALGLWRFVLVAIALLMIMGLFKRLPPV